MEKLTVEQEIERLQQLIQSKAVDSKKLRAPFEVGLEFAESSFESPKLSAVLVLLQKHDQQLSTILIERANDGTVHSGQISFPGGHYEPGDGDLSQTALREAQEEIGLVPQNVRLIGSLSPVYIPVSNFIVYPYVGVLNKSQRFRPNPSEVSKIFVVNLASLMYNSALQRRQVLVRGKLLKVTGYSVNGIFVWGATAKILAELVGYLKLLL